MEDEKNDRLKDEVEPDDFFDIDHGILIDLQVILRTHELRLLSIRIRGGFPANSAG